MDINTFYSVSKEYHSEEFPPNYRKFLLEKFTLQESFVTESLQKLYHTGRLSGTRLLDFGCGPTVHRIASASLHFDDIILSEWSEANRNEVQKWLREDKDAFDWTLSLEKCARAEGFRDLKEGVRVLETKIRKAVKKVVPCDCLAEHILPEGLGLFDVISTNYCLESCCLTVSKFREVLQKLATHLKSGGALAMVSVLEVEEYYVHKTLPGLYLNEEIIRESLSASGLQLKDWFCWKDKQTYETITFGGTAVYYAVKM